DLVDVDEGREHGHVDVVARAEALAQRAGERQRRLALEVHLPVAGDEGLAHARCHRPAAPAVARRTSWRRSSAAIAAASCAIAPNTSTEIACEASERASDGSSCTSTINPSAPAASPARASGR